MAHARADANLETQRGWIVAPNSLWRRSLTTPGRIVERKDQPVSRIRWGAAEQPKQGDMEIERLGQNARARTFAQSSRSRPRTEDAQSEQADWVIMSGTTPRLDRVVQIPLDSYRPQRLADDARASSTRIHELIQQGEENPALGMEHFRFTGRANPRYDWDNFWVEHASGAQEENEIVTTPLDDQKAPSLTNGHDCFDETVQCSAMSRTASRSSSAGAGCSIEANRPDPREGGRQGPAGARHQLRPVVVPARRSTSRSTTATATAPASASGWSVLGK